MYICRYIYISHTGDIYIVWRIWIYPCKTSILHSFEQPSRCTCIQNLVHVETLATLLTKSLPRSSRDLCHAPQCLRAFTLSSPAPRTSPPPALWEVGEGVGRGSHTFKPFASTALRVVTFDPADPCHHEVHNYVVGIPSWLFPNQLSIYHAAPPNVKYANTRLALLKTRHNHNALPVSIPFHKE